jgi:uncharacterized protein YggE
MRRLSPVLVAVILTTLAPLALAAKEQAAGRAPIIVTGRGQASYTPRKVAVSMTLASPDAGAEKSRIKNATKVDALKKELSSLSGLKPSQIQLGAPQTQVIIKRDNNGNETSRGWLTTQTVTVTAPAKDKANIAGKVFDTGAKHGAEVDSPSPVVSERMLEGARVRAENQALKNAQIRAERMAKTLNLKLSGLVSARESSRQGFSGDDFGGLEMARSSRSFGGSTPTQFDVGKQTVRETRVLEFHLE